MKRTLLYIIIFFLISHVAAQQNLSVRADKQQYEIGDYIQITITLNGNKSIQYFWPESDALSSFDLISEKPIDTVVSGQNITLTKELLISIYEAGTVYYPQVIIPYHIPNDTSTYTLVSDSVQLQISGIEVDTTQGIKPITDVLDVSVRKNIWPWVALIIGLLVIVGFLIWYFKFRKAPKQQVVNQVQELPLHTRYLVRLQSLEEKKLWQQDQRKLYYSELTDILRQYLEDRFGISALEHTSEEILQQAGRHHEVRSFVADIRYVLELADMAKFAKSHPIADENIRAMQLVRSFVEQTPILSSLPTEQ